MSYDVTCVVLLFSVFAVMLFLSLIMAAKYCNESCVCLSVCSLA